MQRGYALLDPPFQRVFTAQIKVKMVKVTAVRPAISAGVHSLRFYEEARTPGCQTRHFSGCSQPTTG